MNYSSTFDKRIKRIITKIILFSGVFLFTIPAFSQQEDLYYWKEQLSVVKKDIITFEKDNKVCRVNHPDGILLGKLSNDKCVIFEKENLKMSEYEVLHNTQKEEPKWESPLEEENNNVELPENALIAGMRNGKLLYFGKATHDNKTFYGQVAYNDNGDLICTFWNENEKIEKQSDFKILTGREAALVVFNDPSFDIPNIHEKKFFTGDEELVNLELIKDDKDENFNWHDKITSMIVGTGYKVTIFHQKGYQRANGYAVFFQGKYNFRCSNGDTPQGCWSDKISCIRIEKIEEDEIVESVMFYEHLDKNSNQIGDNQGLGLGTFSYDDTGLNGISSVLIPKDMYVILYDSPEPTSSLESSLENDTKIRQIFLKEGFHNLTDWAFNDKRLSIKIGLNSYGLYDVSMEEDLTYKPEIGKPNDVISAKGQLDNRLASVTNQLVIKEKINIQESWDHTWTKGMKHGWNVSATVTASIKTSVKAGVKIAEATQEFTATASTTVGGFGEYTKSESNSKGKQIGRGVELNLTANCPARKKCSADFTLIPTKKRYIVTYTYKEIDERYPTRFKPDGRQRQRKGELIIESATVGMAKIIEDPLGPVKSEELTSTDDENGIPEPDYRNDDELTFESPRDILGLGNILEQSYTKFVMIRVDKMESKGVYNILSGGNKHVLLLKDMNIWSAHSAAEVVESSIPITSGWNRVAVVYNHVRETMTLYLNDEEGVKGDVSPFEIHPAEVFIGGYDGSGKHPVFDGNIKNVKIWNRALSAEEIKSVLENH